MDVNDFPDAFEHARNTKGLLDIEDHGEKVHMVLGLKEVRKCAHNWKVYSSHTDPGRLIIPSEVDIRGDIRQIPIELDPPEHKGYRNLVESWFKRPLGEDYQKKLERIVNDTLEEVLRQDTVDVVEGFALKLQSRALTVLLNVPFDESETWINWGTHVFRGDGLELDSGKAAVLDDYIAKKIDEAIESPSDDFYSVLLESEIEGTKITRDKVHGILNLTFAGGRDTVINVTTNAIAYFSRHTDALKRLGENPEIIKKAVEEFVRFFTPLTQIGRITTDETEICGHQIQKDAKISLCWASANRDANVFENPNEIVLDRKLNPHVGFGFGAHNCLGATHARQLLTLLLKALSEKVERIELVSATENVECYKEFERKVGFDRLNVKFHSKK